MIWPNLIFILIFTMFTVRLPFLQVMNNYKLRFSKIRLLDPIWFHQRDQIEADMAFMGPLLATMLATPLPALKGAKFQKLVRGSSLFRKSVIHAKNHASGTIYNQSGMVCL